MRFVGIAVAKEERIKKLNRHFSQRSRSWGKCAPVFRILSGLDAPRRVLKRTYEEN